jgi:hypothetical protein
MRITVPSFQNLLLALTMLAGFTMPTLASAATPDTTVVLVHGAFVDGSEWNKVVPLLQAQGLKVVAVQNPLTSLAADVEATKRAIAEQTGKVVFRRGPAIKSARWCTLRPLHHPKVKPPMTWVRNLSLRPV